ncbi:VWA domain-containing protein [Candidatus Pacearchaeota archaeon]|nr:VWA domain-containing protein [Candidatus Pacearchaeota archaeon]
MDAFIAFIIIIGVVLFIKPPSVNISQDMVLQDDLLKVLSDLKIGEINNTYIQSLIATNEITDLNQSVLEQIGEFYANSDSRASAITESIFSELDINEGLAIYFSDNLIANTSAINWTDADFIKTSRQIISGVGGGLDGADGYSSRAFLYSENKIKYFYFGGYIGDGNIALDIGKDVESLKIEADFGKDFSFYLNDEFTKTHTVSPGVPYSFDLSDYSDKFVTGENQILFASPDNIYIAGGYAKVTYNTSPVSNNKYTFPGIDGLINIYDSVYVPGNLTEMDAMLHFNSTIDIFLQIGNTTIYSGNSNGEEKTVVLSNAILSSMLDYNELTGKTVPLRLGLKNISHETNYTVNLEVFSLTDLSGSMNLQGKIEIAKAANKVFVDYILNSSGTRAGLIGYQTDSVQEYYHPLSTDDVSLKSKIDEWLGNAATCVCCGINDGVEKLLNESDPGAPKSLVVMSDGKANVKCSEQGTGAASTDAIKAACDAYNNYGIKVYSIAFGDDADQETLQDIASCGNGNYYYGGIDQMVELYKKIAEDIIRANYVEQTVIGFGIHTELFPDSYINFESDEDIPYGMIITSETDIFANNISQGSFTIPSNSIPYEVNLVSYSGSKWTNLVEVYDNSSGLWEAVFNLTEYGDFYTLLGDPYVIKIPNEKIVEDNTVRVNVALSPENASGGSSYDKVIYSIIKDVAAYSPVLPVANGCVWHIEFEDNTNDTMLFPPTYDGSDDCYYAEDNYFVTGTNIVLANPNDAISYAILNLLESLDLNSNKKIETKFSESDMSLSSIEVSGLPFAWETEVQVRSWQ